MVTAMTTATAKPIQRARHSGMFSFFDKKKSLSESELLLGAIDNHSHILWGVDDGVKTREETLSILLWLEECGFAELWFTPHIMEDVPNTTAGLTARFEELKALYTGPLKLHLAAEYMMDNLFRERLLARDLLLHGDNKVLVETSTWAPPVDFWETLGDIFDYGYQPILAHPERYRYMQEADYDRLHDMGVTLQLNIPSILGHYGPGSINRAQILLDKGWYSMVGSDCHRSRLIRDWYTRPTLSKKTLAQIAPLMK